MRSFRVEREGGSRCVYIDRYPKPVAYDDGGEWIPTAFGVSLQGPRVEIWGPATEERVRELLESGDAEMESLEAVLEGSGRYE